MKKYYLYTLMLFLVSSNLVNGQAKTPEQRLQESSRYDDLERQYLDLTQRLGIVAGDKAELTEQLNVKSDSLFLIKSRLNAQIRTVREEVKYYKERLRAKGEFIGWESPRLIPKPLPNIESTVRPSMSRPSNDLDRLASPPVVSVPPDCSDCERRLFIKQASYEERLSNARSVEESLKATVVRREEDIATLKRSIRDANVELATLEDKYRSVNNSLRCVNRHTSLISDLSSDAESYLKSARDDYYLSVKLTEIRKPSKKQLLLSDSLKERAWSIFQTYSGDTIAMDCGKYKLVSRLDHMSAEDHLVMTYILSNDLKAIINKYGTGTDYRVMQVNAALMANMTQAYQKADKDGNYSLKRDTEKMIHRLASLIVPAAGQEGNSEVIRELTAISKYYDAGQYNKVVSTYSRYERVLFDRNIQDRKELLLTAKHCVGMCLLYNLGDVQTLNGLAYEGSWISKVLPNQQESGAKLLEEVIAGRIHVKQRIYDNSVFALADRYVRKTKSKL